MTLPLPENTLNALPNQAAAASLPQNTLDALPIGGVSPVAISNALPMSGNPVNVTDALPDGADLPDNTVDALPIAAAPTVQFSVPEATLANNAWVTEAGSSVDIWDSVNKTVVDDTTYIRHGRTLGTVTFRMTLFTNPGTTTGFILRIRLRIVGLLNGNDHVGIVYVTTPNDIVNSANCPADALDNNGFAGPWSPGGVPGATLTNAFVTYEWPIDPVPAANIDFVTKQNFSLNYYTGFDASTFVDCSMIHVQGPV